jgi:hypothetical protein
MIDDCKVQIGASSKANARSSWTIVKAILVKTKCLTHEIKHIEI